MLSMQELMDMRMQQQLAHEIYRQQIMQRIPGGFSSKVYRWGSSAVGKWLCHFLKLRNRGFDDIINYYLRHCNLFTFIDWLKNRYKMKSVFL